MRFKLVEPGYCPTTHFTTNGGARMEGLIPNTCAPFAEGVMADLARQSTFTTESDVA